MYVGNLTQWKSTTFKISNEKELKINILSGLSLFELKQNDDNNNIVYQEEESDHVASSHGAVLMSGSGPHNPFKSPSFPHICLFHY